MKRPKSSSGFSALEGLLILVIIAIIGAVGYKIYNVKQNTDAVNRDTIAAADTINQPIAPAVPSINTASDLDKALAALNANDPSSDSNSDLAQLNQQIGQF